MCARFSLGRATVNKDLKMIFRIELGGRACVPWGACFGGCAWGVCVGACLGESVLDAFHGGRALGPFVPGACFKRCVLGACFVALSPFTRMIRPAKSVSTHFEQTC